MNISYSTFLACLFRRSLCRSGHCAKTNVSHYSKSAEGINTKLGILAHHDKVDSCRTRGITLKAVVLELCPFFNLNI